MNNEYTDAHRLFLQASLSERFFTEATAIELYNKAYEATDVQDPEAFTGFIATINTKLNTIDLEFRKSHEEETGTAVWALVNTNGDEIAKLATEYTPIEITYFRRLIELIVTAEDEAFSVSSILALKEASKLKPSISKSNGETLLQRFVDDKWLNKSRGGIYSLSQRTILELQHFLKEEFEDILLECTLCFDIVTKGQRCKVAQCKARFHHHCAHRYFDSRNDKACPTCKIDWDSNIIGDNGSSGSVSRIRKPNNRTMTRVTRRFQETEVGDNDNDNDEMNQDGDDGDDF
ncbi:Nse1 non-SMC component of SMC5-6 complex-domain-containing protein [Glomus cerebriforme]|uniref:Non-structural maintenance of chromosomes element 1 homolog n=1 Tax=Glomus cerebriforme TaxID=658196 RepID=A0A397SAQ9_9GLOM|nr:Nse1 non-SMC component of SMC5-6 complex-domain-containing protein [Glomus cerebriforme]